MKFNLSYSVIKENYCLTTSMFIAPKFCDILSGALAAIHLEKNLFLCVLDDLLITCITDNKQKKPCTNMAF